MSKVRLALYDAECALCQRTKKTVTKLDWFNKLKWASLQEYEKLDYTLSFRPIELRRELHLLVQTDKTVKVLKGFRSIRHMFLLMPSTFVLGLICYIPGVSLIGDPIYKWVAKRRHQFLKGQCHSDSCTI
ncbi:MAG TPA: DUF393 domain-containing protein [Bacillus sp. (in: firmicutes)]|uniref:thiol-disulfide oxidoreductase DCC family protein n=1 Tax=Bacillus litorisediminis TaxID=2922713 RepID=UPI001FACDA55|nr:DUF393 domain-containing protein [Bacillus litorisediminis]HWO75706.1 DUF393 domain-containing protein [Bacillus sp. (in: firmicutes)]